MDGAPDLDKVDYAISMLRNRKSFGVHGIQTEM